MTARVRPRPAVGPAPTLAATTGTRQPRKDNAVRAAVGVIAMPLSVLSSCRVRHESLCGGLSSSVSFSGGGVVVRCAVMWRAVFLCVVLGWGCCGPLCRAVHCSPLCRSWVGRGTCPSCISNSCTYDLEVLALLMETIHDYSWCAGHRAYEQHDNRGAKAHSAFRREGNRRCAVALLLGVIRQLALVGSHREEPCSVIVRVIISWMHRVGYLFSDRAQKARVI